MSLEAGAGKERARDGHLGRELDRSARRLPARSGLVLALAFGPRGEQQQAPPSAALSQAPEAAEREEDGAGGTSRAGRGRRADELPEESAAPPRRHRRAATDACLRGRSFTADLTISGMINRAFLVWDDGGESDAYFVDNAQDGTFRRASKAMSSSASGWTIGAVFGVDIILAPSDEVDQFDADRLRQQAVRVGSLCQHRPRAAGHGRRRLRRYGERRHRQHEFRGFRYAGRRRRHQLERRLS